MGQKLRAWTGVIVAVAAVMACAFVSSRASGAYITVYGTPPYTPGVGGFKAINPTGQNAKVANSGTAAGYAQKFNSSGPPIGDRAVRWDAVGTSAIELGNLGTDTTGTTNVRALAINTAGTAAGYADKYNGSGTYLGYRAVRWDASGTAATELGNLGTNISGSTFVQALAINTSGTSVGYANKYNGSGTNLGGRAVRWDASGTAATELGNLGTSSSGSTYAQGSAINASGTAVGYANKYNTSGTFIGERAVRWNASGTAATELGNLGTNSSGDTTTDAKAINTAGTAVGYAQKYTSGAPLGWRAVRWNASGTAAIELGNLGTDSSGTTYALARDINTAGTAVGYAWKYDGSGTFFGECAVRWDSSGTAATELGNLGTDSSGSTSAEAWAVNAAGITVGYGAKYDGSGTYLGARAVLWLNDGVALDLNTLIDPGSGWTLQRATAISDTNFVAGYGQFDPDGAGGQAAYARLFVMNVSSAVPEPSSLGLLAVGALGLMRRRRPR